MVVWSLLYISDYALTLVCARLHQAQKTIGVEGSYELTPFFQRDINSLRVLSPRFVAMLLLGLGMLGFLWILNEQSPAPQLYQFTLGYLVVVELAIHIRHLRNLSFLRSIKHTNMVRGRTEYARAILLRMSAWEWFGFSGLFLILFTFTQSWFILGGATRCLQLGVEHGKRAGRLAKASQFLEQTKGFTNTA